MNIGLIDTAARYSPDAGYHVVLEGILYADRYGQMLQQLHADHRGHTHSYYLDVPFPETPARQATTHRRRGRREAVARLVRAARAPARRHGDLADGSLADTGDHIVQDTDLARRRALEH